MLGILLAPLVALCSDRDSPSQLDLAVTATDLCGQEAALLDTGESSLTDSLVDSGRTSVGLGSVATVRLKGDLRWPVSMSSSYGQKQASLIAQHTRLQI